MRRRIGRRYIVRIRLSVRGLRHTLHPYRLVIAGGAGGLGAVLGAVYDQIETHLRIVTIVAIGVLTAMAVVLTEPPKVSDEQIRAEQASLAVKPPRPRRDGSGRRPASGPARPRMAWWRWWPRRIAPTLPPGDGPFCGRVRELAELTARHEAARAARQEPARSSAPVEQDAGRGTTGPVLLLIHGKPGVGKSALALELGRRLADQYPHGQVYANLGTLRDARTPREILGILLKALGWPEAEIPLQAVECAKIFRSLTTRRRMLFVLDAARQPDQVLKVLPADPRAAVIVTSRRDFGADLGAPSYPLDVPDQDEAIAILRSASGTDDGTRPECAAQIVQACGALPLAIRAAAERVNPAGAELCHVAGLLAPPSSRLSWLERPDISVVERIASEYDRLLDQEKRALQLLTLIDSPTFVPWVLAPLLNVASSEAENLVAQLGAAQMLDNVRRDEATGLARYSFHPLVRLFAEAKLSDEVDTDERTEARRRLDEAYREVVMGVLGRVDRTFWIPPPPPRYLAAHSDVPRRLAQDPEPWVRAEYRNLLRCIQLSSADEPALCWRIAARLDGCVPDELDPESSLEAYDLAVKAARTDHDELGLIQVLLAKGSFLNGVERYRDGQETLAEVARLAQALRRGEDRHKAREATRMAVLGQRKMGEACLQMGAYEAADEMFRNAYRAAAANGDDAEQRLVWLLLAETRQVDSPDPDEVDSRGGDSSRFRAILGSAEAARRRREWVLASEYLDRALEYSDDDAQREATVRYRMARLNLAWHLQVHGWPRGPSPVRVGGMSAESSLADHAVRHAAEAVLIFRRTGNKIGEVRAHCVLTRALLAAGHEVEAQRVGHAAERELAAIDAQLAGPALGPLTARVWRAMGDLLLCHGDVVNGRRRLMQAATLFGQEHDWGAQTEALHRLRDLPWPADSSAAHEHLVPSGPLDRSNGTGAVAPAQWRRSAH
ncbi:MAG TPA: NB-ARC domain-containing protein [Rugosimonospora sp.]